MPKKKAASKEVEPLPCPVCGRVPEVKREHSSAGYVYYLICKDTTILSFHEIHTQAWETEEMAIVRWNHAIKTLEKRRARNIRDREIWGV